MNRLLPVLLLAVACSTPTTPPPADAPAAGTDLHIQVVRLENAPVQDVAKALEKTLAVKPTSGVGFKIAVQPEQNALVLSGTTGQIRDALEVVARLDVPPRR